MQPIGFVSNLQQAVIGAEANARAIYFTGKNIIDSGKEAWNWLSEHIIFEIEGSIDLGYQFKLDAKVAGFEVGGQIQKDVTPLLHTGFGYNKNGDYNGWYAYNYQKIPFLPYINQGGYYDSNSWGVNFLFWGTGRTYNNFIANFLSWGDLETSYVNWGPIKVTDNFNYGALYPDNFDLTWENGFDLALFLGLHFNMKIGFGNFHYKK